MRTHLKDSAPLTSVSTNIAQKAFSICPVDVLMFSSVLALVQLHRRCNPHRLLDTLYVRAFNGTRLPILSLSHVDQLEKPCI